jgi:hypothetical protein
MLVKIAGLEKNVIDTWMNPLGPSLLKGVKMLLRLVLKFPASILRSKTI